jgi:Family of unknown function (DUF6982)
VQNRIVVRYADGQILKGTTADFSPGRPTFHVAVAATGGATAGTEEVWVDSLKAVFFVKDFSGNATYNEVKAFEGGSVQGRKIEVEFVDGERLVGTTMGYQPDRPGFFLVPADPKSNNERCFIVKTAVRGVKFL